MTVRNKMVEKAIKWLGKNEADGSFKEIIDIYNRQSRLPRGYKVKYGDAWCAVFVSSVALENGMEEVIPIECSCGQMIAKAKEKGIWVENDDFCPKAGDIILYDRNDTGKGDNVGWPEHVGLVEKTENGVIYVIEGNLDNKVARRKIAVNGKTIRGFITPLYPKVEESRFYPRYEGTTNSIVDALKALKIDSTYKHRTVIAHANGIAEYSGKAKENLTLLGLLKDGKLKME